MSSQPVVVDSSRCDGCGNCVTGCAEGALQVIDGKARVLSDNLCDGLGACIGDCPQDALEIIASLRIQHQANQIRRKQPADNYVPPDDLSELEREHLKHAFRVIQTMQESMVKRFGADNSRD